MSDIELKPSSPTHTLAIVNARVLTRDARRPWADAVLLRADRIEAVGSSAEVRKRAGTAAKVIDARGLLLTSLRVDGVLVKGGPGDLMLIDRPLGQIDAGGPHDDEIVLTIEAGRIVTDRDSLAR